MSDFSLVLQMAALGTGFCFLMTTLGAASVLFRIQSRVPENFSGIRCRHYGGGERLESSDSIP